MLIKTARSSSLSQLEMCENKYFLTYVLGMRDRSNIKSTMGTVVHRVLQCLGDKKIALQKGEEFVDFEGEKLTLAQCDDLDDITKRSFDYYTVQEPDLNFTKSHYTTCRKWVDVALSYNNGMLDPRNQDIYTTEKYFEYTIDKDWAEYDYYVGDQRITGNLKIRGTIDIILNEGEKKFHILDYKSGRRMNWATFKEKTYDDLEFDPQLLLYFYSMRTLYPDYEFVVSIYFMNDGGLFSYVYDEEHFKRAENMIRQKFEYIKSVEVPKMISPDNTSKTCQYLCGFTAKREGSDRSICQSIHDEVVKKGIHSVTSEYIDWKSLNSYTGGGRIAE